jgi:hypothetical protein
MTAPNPTARLTMAKGIMAAFWKDTPGPPTFDMRWETCGEMRQKVWLACADAAFETGRQIKAATPNKALREIAA